MLGNKHLIFLILAGVVMTACEMFEPAAPPDSQLLDGPIAGLNEGESFRFLRGDIAFNNRIFTPATGLGPIFVASSCGSCHPGDGKGHPFTTLMRFGQSDSTGNQFHDKGGPQWQNRAIPGFKPETIPSGTGYSKFTPPANTGLGYIDAVSDEDILQRADPFDSDGDGISGVPNWVALKDYLDARPNSVTRGGKYIGRFGKKASTYDLLQQTSQAYNQDIGITSSFEDIDTHTGLVADPEISNQEIHDVVFYLKTLKAPVPRESVDAIAGETIFETIGCEKCHRKEFQTGISDVPVLSGKDFYPYTDLLLHDMGSALDDGYTEGTARTSEWRTPPLWGLGLSKNSQGGGYFLMHDGRARSIEEAISLHGGEGTGSKEKFQSLSVEEKKKLIQFLESL